jgi:hypothetical protein
LSDNNSSSRKGFLPSQFHNLRFAIAANVRVDLATHIVSSESRCAGLEVGIERNVQKSAWARRYMAITW